MHYYRRATALLRELGPLEFIRRIWTQVIGPLPLIHYLGRIMQRTGLALSSYKGLRGIWIDVGAHLGQNTFGFALANPKLMVYAFEPNIEVAIKRIGLLPNFVVIPMAVSEQDGCIDFYVNTFDQCSSILPIDPNVGQNWIENIDLTVQNKICVPTIRLDTFLNLVKIPKIDYLKIDAQGADLSVIKSAGQRLRDIQKITFEVQTTTVPLYIGASRKDETITYLEDSGFTFLNREIVTKDKEEDLTFIRVN